MEKANMTAETTEEMNMIKAEDVFRNLIPDLPREWSLQEKLLNDAKCFILKAMENGKASLIDDGTFYRENFYQIATITLAEVDEKCSPKEQDMFKEYCEIFKNEGFPKEKFNQWLASFGWILEADIHKKGNFFVDSILCLYSIDAAIV